MTVLSSSTWNTVSFLAFMISDEKSAVIGVIILQRWCIIFSHSFKSLSFSSPLCLWDYPGSILCQLLSILFLKFPFGSLHLLFLCWDSLSIHTWGQRESTQERTNVEGFRPHFRSCGSDLQRAKQSSVCSGCLPHWPSNKPHPIVQVQVRLISKQKCGHAVGIQVPGEAGGLWSVVCPGTYRRVWPLRPWEACVEDCRERPGTSMGTWPSEHMGYRRSSELQKGYC